MQIYKCKAYDKTHIYYFELMPGYWAWIGFIWSIRKKKYLPDYGISYTQYVPKRTKDFKPSTRQTFIKHIGKTPEYVKGMLLRRLRREMGESISRASKAREIAERDIVAMKKIQKRAKKAERLIK
jgi:hypothetical protein